MKLDRMKVQQKLIEAGVPREQATSHAEVFGEMQDELATKADLEAAEKTLKDSLEATNASIVQTNNRLDKTNEKVENINSELANLRVEISKSATKLVVWSVSTILATGGLVVAILRLTPS